MMPARRDAWAVWAFAVSWMFLLGSIFTWGLIVRELRPGSVAGGAASGPPRSTVAPFDTSKCPASSGLTGNVNDHGSALVRGTTLTLAASDSYFAPTCEVGLSPGALTLVVKNTGLLLHNVSVPDQGIDQDVAGGETVTVQLKIDPAPLHFFCKYHRTSGMVGALLPPLS